VPALRLGASDAFQQVEGSPWLIEFSEDCELRRACACRQLGMTGGACELRMMAVDRELFDQLSSQVRVGLDNEYRLSPRSAATKACLDPPPVANCRDWWRVERLQQTTPHARLGRASVVSSQPHDTIAYAGQSRRLVVLH
jgi:hypothetical protein